jgi:ABC-type arginine/histidine transport system permease subunit
VCVFVPVVRILETGSHLLLALGIESNAESRFLSTTTTITRRGHKRLARLQIFHFIHLFSSSFLFVGDFFFVFAGFKFFKLAGRRAGKCFMI